jgi:energy-coupling factor transporter ATP-binding protein EcfA2
MEAQTDEVVVMRDGKFVARADTAEVSRQQMANLMVGRDVSDMFQPKHYAAPDAQVALRVSGLTVPGWVRDLSFDVRAGEILGFAGLVGAGRTVAFEGLFGLRPKCAESIEVAGRQVRIRDPRDAMLHGLAYLSEDRKGKGLHLDMSLAQNLTMMTAERDANPWLDVKGGRAALDAAIADFGIRSSLPRFHFANLEAGTVTSHLVTHGLGSDPDHDGWLHWFSNEPGSFATSRGAYVTYDWYNGKYGMSLRLGGLDHDNSNALDRAIVMHSAPYATQSCIAEHGVLGRSNGCFAMAPDDFMYALTQLSGGRLIYADKLT